jgi:pyridoxamine 5'-phosphate oxidase
MNTEEIAQIRKEYTLKSLDKADLEKEPIIQFQKWLKDAMDAMLPEPTAMNLATVSKEGRPSSRIVLLKGIENKQFIFYSNFESKKGIEMERNPYVALNFHWVELERQVRIEGIIHKHDEKISETYFQSRPKLSQVGAWASPQSKVIDSREYLEQKFQEIDAQYAQTELLPKPANWGGYAVEPYYLEFWQGRRSRLHDRMIYEIDQNTKNWTINRLAP